MTPISINLYIFSFIINKKNEKNKKNDIRNLNCGIVLFPLP